MPEKKKDGVKDEGRCKKGRVAGAAAGALAGSGLSLIGILVGAGAGWLMADASIDACADKATAEDDGDGGGKEESLVDPLLAGITFAITSAAAVMHWSDDPDTRKTGAWIWALGVATQLGLAYSGLSDRELMRGEVLFGLP